MTRRLLLLLAAVLALGLGLAACGGDDEDDEEPAPAAEETTEDTSGDGGGGATTIALVAAADGSLAFDQSSLSAPAGEVTIELTNESGIPHNVAIDGVDEVSDTITEGSTSLTVTLEPGEYTFYCAVPGHREGGMEGTLTVE